MSKYHVFYILLSREQTDELNGHPLGWASPIGQAYGSASHEPVYFCYHDAEKFGMIKLAASLDIKTDRSRHIDHSLEEVWEALQNFDKSWTEKENIRCHTDFPRSCDVGDLIYDVEEDKLYRVCGMGFTEITSDNLVNIARTVSKVL